MKNSYSSFFIEERNNFFIPPQLFDIINKKIFSQKILEVNPEIYNFNLDLMINKIKSRNNNLVNEGERNLLSLIYYITKNDNNKNINNYKDQLNVLNDLYSMTLQKIENCTKKLKQ